MPKYRTVRGMRDFLPKEAKIMRYIESLAREIAELYGYQEVITPVVESYELLAAKSGEEIRQRMYAFNDLGGRRIALRPEFTASIARLVATTLKNEPKPLRLFCIGSLYRYDEPQQGRYREFWQSNFELMGSSKPEADVEILSLTNNLMKKTSLKNYWFKIGHMGMFRGVLSQEGITEEKQNQIMQKLDKKLWNEALNMIKEEKTSKKCIEVVKSLIETSGKETKEVLGKAKKILKDYEEAVDAVENLEEIIELTIDSGQKIQFSVDLGFARGLEYYTGMIFEVFVPELEIALGGGGRYDKLIELFGGEPTPAVGVAHGIDRISLAMKKQKIIPQIREKTKILVVSLNKKLKAKSLEIASVLRENGFCVETEVMGRKVSRVLETANRKGIAYVVLVAPKEMKEGKVVLRDMNRREQETVSLGKLVEEIRTR